MASISFSPHVRSHVAIGSSDGELHGATVREALEGFFSKAPRLRGYLLDDRGAVRKHVSVFVNGESVKDRTGLSDPLPEDAEIYVMQALSGG